VDDGRHEEAALHDGEAEQPVGLRPPEEEDPAEDEAGHVEGGGVEEPTARVRAAASLILDVEDAHDGQGLEPVEHRSPYETAEVADERPPDGFGHDRKEVDQG